MELVLLTIFLAVSIPAWGLKLAKEHRENKRFEKERESLREESDRWKKLLTPPPDVVSEVSSLMPRYNGPSSDIYAPEFKRWFFELKEFLFEECGLAEDFEAIYGESWREDAQLIRSMLPGDPGYKWNLKGFHNSPVNENLTLRWPEKKAVEALLYARRGYIPRDSAGVRLCVNVIPYSYTDWNGYIGTAWYRRIEELLREAGKPVTMYFYKDADQQKDGAYFAHLPGTDPRW